MKGKAFLMMGWLKIAYLRIAYIGRQLRLGISEGNLVAKYESKIHLSSVMASSEKTEAGTLTEIMI